MFFTNYTCSRCGATVTKNTRVCPNCHANLAGIKCKNCGFSGIEADFVNDSCPKCHSTVTTSSTPAVKYCPKCHQKWDALHCEKCGHTSKGNLTLLIMWGIISTGLVVFAIVALIQKAEGAENAWCVILPMGAVAAYCWFRLIEYGEKRKKFQNKW